MITSYFNNFRDLVKANIDEVDNIIGGEDIIMEIDESKFGKRKYN